MFPFSFFIYVFSFEFFGGAGYDVIMSNISSHYNDIQMNILQAARDSGRVAEDIILTAVSKKQPMDRIEALLALGHRVYGENRVQEAQERWGDSGLRERHKDLQLRLIGPLQSNKVKDAVSLFDVIETLDRPKLAKKLSAQEDAQGKKLSYFVQVNTGEEPQKAGISPLELGDFVAYCRQDCALDVRGLMAIPPQNEPAGLHFGLLRQWAEKLSLPHLSMGMSSDYVLAIKYGATHVRVGSALFGARDAV